MPTSSLRSDCLCRAFLLWACVCCLASMARVNAADVLTPQSPVTFEQHVRPILKAFCLDCHGGGEQLEGKLDLRLKRFMLTGGESGATLRVGQPAESLLIESSSNACAETSLIAVRATPRPQTSRSPTTIPISARR